MVSHIESPSPQPVLEISRRPSWSATSRSSTRRHGCSNHHQQHQRTTSTPVPTDEFPIFSQTGNVEIIIASPSGRREQRYLLHAMILSQASPFFATNTNFKSLPAPSTCHSSSRLGQDTSSTTSLHSVHSHLCTYVLDWHHARDDQIPRLIKRPAPISPPPSSPFVPSMSNPSDLSLSPESTAPPTSNNQLLRDYDNLFRIFYNYAPLLSTTNIVHAYTDSKSLLHLAQMYHVLNIVGPRIDHHLLTFSTRLFKQIARYPASYLKLACLAKSRVIYAEALIHTVGSWPQSQSQLINNINPLVLDIIRDKVQELEDLRQRTELRLFRLTLTTTRGERVNPSNAYLDWMAMSLFRQWLAENTTPAPVSILKTCSPQQSTTIQALIKTKHAQPPPPPLQNPFHIYNLIANRNTHPSSSSSSSYLTHSTCKSFLKLTPHIYSRQNLKRFEQSLLQLQNLATHVVAPLMRSFLKGGNAQEGGRDSLGYLTCTRVLDEDFPWEM
jgi:hypothetical protein